MWLVDLPAGTIEVYRDPSPRGYASTRTAGGGETLTPLALADVALQVDDIIG